MKYSVVSVVIAFALSNAVTAVPLWGQCGGIGYSGSTVCDSGVCTRQNDYYYQCIPGTGPAPTSTTQPGGGTTTTSTRTSSAPPQGTNSICPGNLTKFKFFGTNQAGAEFGGDVLPGVLGTHYTWPSPSSIDYFVGQGFNSFRIPFSLERLSPNTNGGLTGSFDQTYLNGLKTIVNYVTNKGSSAIIEPHNYMRYYGSVITNTNDFKTWWRNLANEFKNNARVVFDVMNEPHTMEASKAFELNQAAVDGIRASGATQLIFVEGTAWSGAWSWESSGNGNYYNKIADPLNNFAIEMHQYLDSDSSGTSATCVSSTIGRERLAVATEWLKRNNLKGYLGEIGAGSNSVCIEAVKSALCSMQQSGVWLGVAWWAAGPWWGTYFQSIEPPNGAAISQILPQALKPFI